MPEENRPEDIVSEDILTEEIVVDPTLTQELEADLDDVMKKYDRESNTRIWEGTPRLIVRVLTILFSVYCIWSTLFSTAIPEVRLNLFIAFVIILGYLYYPVKKGTTKVNHLPFYDIILMIIGTVPLFYFALNAHSIIQQATRVTQNPMMMVMAVASILAVVELCRRCVGLPILVVLGALLIYTFTEVRFGKAIYDLFYTTTGLMNTPINVAAKYIVVFIIFGAFLERTGISNFFIALANSLAGAAPGGPAKVAVISSALTGMVSGSSVGNTVTTGSVTIPMMKKTGYQPEFAGAVEAAASTGGQIMPPIMGAAAFLMAEYMGIPYGQVALKAILPAVLYFTGIYIAVHLEARKKGLRGIPRHELPKIKSLLPKTYLLLPLIVLVVMVTLNTRTMQFSATVAIGMTILVGLVNKDDRLTVEKFFDALEAGGKGSIVVAVACAVAGLIAGAITSTGLASTLITLIVNISGGQIMIALFLTMISCIILGMGVPTTANYAIMAATTAPILMSPAIGVQKVAAHFFVFYFGIVADITPPVALAAYAGSAIAKAKPMKTAINATKLAIAAFLVPYIIAMNPALVFEFEPGLSSASIILQVIQIIITSLLGVFSIAAGLNGFLYRTIPVLLRVLMVAGGLAMMIPGTATDIGGLIFVAAVYFYLRKSAGPKVSEQA